MFVLGLLVVTLASAGCRGRSASLPLDLFATAIGADPETFDPGVMSGSVEGRIAWQLFEGLYSAPREDGGPLIPGVAERHEVSEDGLTYRFFLRSDARWSNGDPVTAHDFVFSWRRVLSDDIASYYVSFLRYLKNGRAYEEGQAGADAVGVRALSDHILEVELEHPVPYFVEVTTFFTFLPVHRGSIERHGHVDAFRAENLVTNGPFRMSRYARRNVIELVRNEHYWAAEEVHFSRVRFLIIEDDAAKVSAFEDGRVDWIDELPANQVPLLRMRPDFHSVNLLGTYYYRFNVTRPPLDDVRVRRALSLAINREELCRCTLDDLYVPATSFVPPMPGFTSPEGLVRYDPEEARRLLAEAGYPGGQGLPRLTLLYNTSENHRIIAQAIQDIWSTELGVRIDLLNQEWKVYLDSTRELDFDIGRAGWIGDYLDPNTFLELWKTGDANNNTGWGDARFDALIEGSFSILDPAARKEALAEAEAILLQAHPVMPLYYYSQKHLVRANVRGWTANTLGVYLIRFWSKQEEGGR